MLMVCATLLVAHTAMVLNHVVLPGPTREVGIVKLLVCTVRTVLQPPERLFL